MTIVLTGGGSGGHITPILAVAHELRRLQPDSRLVYIGQTGDSFRDVPKQDPNIDAVYSVRAGKFRRYHGQNWLQHLQDVPTVLKNIRDVAWVAVGFWQSRRLLKKIQPNCIFIKGGFVGVPVGLAAATLHIPFVTHDSDALPGLANRIIGRWAATHAVALPKEVYNYPANKTVTVGVPVQTDFHAVSLTEQRRYRQEIGLASYHRILLVTGGGLGAQRLNTAIASIAASLLKAYPDLAIVQIAGRSNEEATRHLYDRLLKAEMRPRVIIEGYRTDLFKYSGAADVIVTRAGATSLAEFAVQGKACIIVPNPLLTGGHQLKNAEYLAKQLAIKIVPEPNNQTAVSALERSIHELLDDTDLRVALGKQFSTFARLDAAEQLACLVIDQAKPQKTDHVGQGDSLK